MVTLQNILENPGKFNFWLATMYINISLSVDDDNNTKRLMVSIIQKTFTSIQKFFNGVYFPFTMYLGTMEEKTIRNDSITEILK